MTISEKAAYLKGLVDGLSADKDSRDGKLWSCVSDLISDMAHEIEELQDTNTDFADALDEFSEDLTYLEEITCDLDTPDDFGCCEDECDGNCESCGECAGCSDRDSCEFYDEDEAKLVAFADYSENENERRLNELFRDFNVENSGDEDEPEEDGEPEDAQDEDEDPEYDGVLYDVICPACGEEISFDEETLKKGSIVCPKCKELLEFDLSEEEE